HAFTFEQAFENYSVAFEQCPRDFLSQRLIFYVWLSVALQDGPAPGTRHLVDGLSMLPPCGCLCLATAWSQESTQSSEAIRDHYAVRNQFRQRFFNLTAQELRVLDDVGEERRATCVQIVVDHLCRRRKFGDARRRGLGKD